MNTTDNYISMYEKMPNLVFGFHGCNKKTYENVLYRQEELQISANKYDWLGNGIYFWENSYQRAYDWANERYGEQSAVLGAVIDLGRCLNLTDYHASDILKRGYDILKLRCEVTGNNLPKNKKGKSKTDFLLRDLDCAVIQQIHEFNREKGIPKYDSVRGVFVEGAEVYPGAGIKEKTHIQLCITNPNCIKGFFSPRREDSKYNMP